MRMFAGLLSLLLFATFTGMAQNKGIRILDAKRTSHTVTIDGVLNDSAWQDAAIMTDLIEFRPTVGAHEDRGHRTVAYLMYDNEGIYFSGFCYERTKDSIATEFKGRDGFGTNDYIGIIFDTYGDKLNGFEYFLTPLGDQWDAKMNPPSMNGDMEDFSWNAVWQGAARITDSGWSFEIFIPFSAIRFGKKDLQDWGFNITRRRRKTEQQYTWSPIDPNVNGFLTQEGIWKGLSHIKPPLRLQLSPYFSVYANHYPFHDASQKNWTSQVNGGMDIKYGINQAFTIDATLIPDFGQVQSDNLVLNLTPFEVKYNEYRPFFTEGTELFSKGNLFYSRRIGGTPIHEYDVYNETGANEKVLRNPTESKLINATKVSGRTQHGLGIGFLNAVTKASYATLEDTVTGQQRNVLTNPLTNYNMVVLDQTLKHNSSISFVNTSVWREGHDFDANVSAALFELFDKKNTWNLGGKFAVSNLIGYLPSGKTQTGISHEIHFGKSSGRFNFNVSQERTDTLYSSNDLGYFTYNNYLNHYVWLGYRWTQPKNWYNHIYINFNGELDLLSSKIQPLDKTYKSARLNANGNIQSKKLWWVGASMNYWFEQNDFYEPRVEGWFFKRGASMSTDVWFESNDSKKYAFSIDFFARPYIDFYRSVEVNTMFDQKMRFNNHLSLQHNISFYVGNNNMGYVFVEGSPDINFAKRHVTTIEQVLSPKYSFSNKMGITLRARHYLSKVENRDFYLLQHDGSLLSHPGFHPPTDQNVNYFNIDLVYTWEFAPGSFLNIVWKDAAESFSNNIEKKYFKNLGRTITDDSNNNFSLKVIYLLDYLKLKRSLR